MKFPHFKASRHLSDHFSALGILQEWYLLVSLGFVRDISLYVTWRHAARILCLTGGLLSPDFQAKPEDPAERGHPERFDLRISSDFPKWLEGNLLNTSCLFCCQSRNLGSMYTYLSLVLSGLDIRGMSIDFQRKDPVVNDTVHTCP